MITPYTYSSTISIKVRWQSWIYSYCKSCKGKERLHNISNCNRVRSLRSLYMRWDSLRWRYTCLTYVCLDRELHRSFPKITFLKQPNSRPWAEGGMAAGLHPSAMPPIGSNSLVNRPMRQAVCTSSPKLPLERPWCLPLFRACARGTPWRFPSNMSS